MKKGRKRNDRAEWKIMLAALALIFVMIGWGCRLPEEKRDEMQTVPAAEKTDPLRIHFLKAGKGDCILLERDGYYLMIDTGHGEDMEHICGYMDALGVKRLDGLILTHMHADHIGSAAGILETYGADQVWMRDQEMDSGAYSKLKNVLEKNSVTVTEPKAGDEFVWQGCRFVVLGPGKEYDEYNNMSLVIYMEYAGHRYLFTGDMEKEAEKDLLENPRTESVCLANLNVLKVGHHGGNDSSGEEFLRMVQPDTAVICCGRQEEGEGPGEKTLARLEQYAGSIYQTDGGDVILTDDGQTILIEITETGVLPQKMWIGNLKTGVYHRADCDGLPAVQNRCYFADEQEAEAAGYRPCGRCLP